MWDKIFDSRFVRVSFVAVLCLCLYLSFQTCNNRGVQIAQTQVQLQTKHDTVLYYKDAYDIEHARVEALQADLKNVRHTDNIDIDNLSKALHVAKKEIVEASFIKTKTENKIIPEVLKTTADTCFTEYDINWQDKWTNISGHIGKQGSSLTCNITDHLLASQYYKRSWFLGKKKLYFDVYSENPNTAITGLEDIANPVTMPGRFGLGVFGGLQYGGGKWQPVWGVGVSYQLIRF